MIITEQNPIPRLVNQAFRELWLEDGFEKACKNMDKIKASLVEFDKVTFTPDLREFIPADIRRLSPDALDICLITTQIGSLKHQTQSTFKQLSNEEACIAMVRMITNAFRNVKQVTL